MALSGSVSSIPVSSSMEGKLCKFVSSPAYLTPGHQGSHGGEAELYQQPPCRVPGHFAAQRRRKHYSSNKPRKVSHWVTHTATGDLQGVGRCTHFRKSATCTRWGNRAKVVPVESTGARSLPQKSQLSSCHSSQEATCLLSAAAFYLQQGTH